MKHYLLIVPIVTVISLALLLNCDMTRRWWGIRHIRWWIAVKDELRLKASYKRLNVSFDEEGSKRYLDGILKGKW